MANDSVTIFHNPNCGTSRNVLAALKDAGLKPSVVEYLKAGWTKPQLMGLLAAMKARPRDILRTRGTNAETLGLTASNASDEAILRRHGRRAGAGRAPDRRHAQGNRPLPPR